jgi:hypothetical protein
MPKTWDQLRDEIGDQSGPEATEQHARYLLAELDATVELQPVGEETLAWLVDELDELRRSLLDHLRAEFCEA